MTLRTKAPELGLRAIDRWIRAEGKGAQTRLHRSSGVSPPTIRRAVKGLAIRQDCAQKIADIVGGEYAELTINAKGKSRARKR